MIWKMKEIDQQTLTEVANKINGKKIFDRLSYNLNIHQDQLLNYIDIDNAKMLLATLLINRGLKDDTDLLNNPEKYILRPELLHNATKAADIIKKYCEDDNAYIYIYADYDVDGVTAGYVFSKALKEVAKCKVNVKFPDRDEGYGLSMNFCKTLVLEHTDEIIDKVTDKVLVITVDNGISKSKEVEYLKDNNVEVVITDHHQSKDAEGVPNCLIVDPHNTTEKQDDTYKHLCGCGVAFKVAQLVQEHFGVNNMYNYFPYLALATIADVMPMNKENLSFIQYGLDIINSVNCPEGIKELKRQENIDYLTTTNIGWTIGPMINACGRLGNTELATKLFFTEDLYVSDVVSKIRSTNDSRKNSTKRAVKELSKMDIQDNKAFIWDTQNKYPNGILGIIAGKASELFDVPSIVVSGAKNSNKLHGSARSARGVNLMSIMETLYNEGLITQYGGHADAVGIYFNRESIPLIQQRLNELIEYKEVEEQVVEEEILEIDQILSLEHLNVVMLALSELLPSDGRTINYPTFAITNCELKSFKVYPSGYMEVTLKQGNTTLDMSAMGFAETFTTEILPKLDEMGSKNINVAGTISKHFKTKKYVLNIKDIAV